jgi:photosystem II stability/assembly factor-like uncharacterized protein
MKTIESLLAMVFFCALFIRAQDQLSIGVLGGSNLRGVSAVTDRIVWVSGSKGTIARTTDAGQTWQRLTAPQGAEDFDFRDVEAFSADTAFVMSAGPGEQSRIWKTSGGGKSWQQQYTNPSPDFFLDSLACWRDMQQGKQQCVALSDPVGGKFLVLLTDDGEHWRELPRDHMPAALIDQRTGKDGKQEDLKEGAFAASGTAITALGNNIWFGTGGPKARVFHSADRGHTWTVAETPIMHGEASQGIFSIAFHDAKHGVIVGGDYKQPAKTGANLAFTSNGGKSWTLAEPTRPNSPMDANHLPYCSAVAYSNAKDRMEAVGPQGLYVIVGEGKSAQVARTGETHPFNAMSSSWLVGPEGSILLRVEPPAPSLQRPSK